MTVSYDEFDVNFLVQIAEVYVYFLKDQEFSMEYERVSEMVCTIHRLSHQVLESFKMVDLKNKLKIGTTKNSRLSSKEYKILMSVGYLNVILSNTSKKHYQKDKSLIFQIILNVPKGHFVLKSMVLLKSEISQLSMQPISWLTDSSLNL